MARGSIFTRTKNDGSLTYYVKFRTADGTQVKRAVKGGRRDAQAELTRALAAVDRGELRTISRDRFEAAAHSWLERKRPRVEPSTHQDYETHLRLRLIPAFGDLKLTQITRARIELYMAALDKEGILSRKTINDSLIPLRQILGRAVRDGQLPNNPALSTDPDDPLELPYEQPPMLYLSRADALRYLTACPVDYRLLAEVLIGSGIRIGEALALEWRDVDWDSPALRIQRAVKKRRAASRKQVIGTTKSDRPRTVYIAPYLTEMLRRDRVEQDAWGTAPPLIFPSDAGTHLDQDNVRGRWHAATVKAAGLPPKLRLHDLRHTAATIWLASGESIYFVKEQLGHADIQTTIDLYGHPDQAAHSEAAVRAAAWWRTPTG